MKLPQTCQQTHAKGVGRRVRMRLID